MSLRDFFVLGVVSVSAFLGIRLPFVALLLLHVVGLHAAARSLLGLCQDGALQPADRRL
jgi:hypothetical protein